MFRHKVPSRCSGSHFFQELAIFPRREQQNLYDHGLGDHTLYDRDAAIIRIWVKILTFWWSGPSRQVYTELALKIRLGHPKMNQNTLYFIDFLQICTQKYSTFIDVIDFSTCWTQNG